MDSFNNFIVADIGNRLYEAGILRENERVIMLAESCALLEQTKDNHISYRAANFQTMQTKYLFARKTALPAKQYAQTVEKIRQLAINIQPEDIQIRNVHERAKDLLSFIFTDILPKHGMVLRDKQRELALEMLEALQEHKLALCEAEVGTGKTHAYILAVTIYNLFSETRFPTVISTSTIALQKALTEEYIPQISAILMEHRIMDRPLSFVVRKGKAHYVCDARLKTYDSSIRNLNREQDKELLEALRELARADSKRLDMDAHALTPYVKARICVSLCNPQCPRYESCRFIHFTRLCLSGAYDFQIANHNYVLADVISRKDGRKRLLPIYGIAVFDEAHKIMEAARQMYGSTLSDTEIPGLTAIASLKLIQEKQTRLAAAKLCAAIRLENECFFQEATFGIRDEHTRENRRYALELTPHLQSLVKRLILRLEQFPEHFVPSDPAFRQRCRVIRQTSSLVVKKLQTFLDLDGRICWAEKTENGGTELYSIPKELGRLLYEDLWDTGLRLILTSGTMSVSGDFSHFKHSTGVGLLQPDNRIIETCKPSPFNYEENALLYIPERMPFPDIREEPYMRAVTAEIKKLIRATHGHTLILFTSYWLMERVYYSVQQDHLPFPLFIMGRGRLDAIETFRKSGNGVLFASDSAGEGIDLAGDILSNLIVVKLPFPVPDPVTDYERSLYTNMDDYLAEVITPNMLIKLRQWFGRGIRTETDTAVFSILDSRAGLRGKYRHDILSALPPMPLTDRINDVERFILEKKDRDYFI
jgi:ATP-dependent DNA helicase DinG